MASELQITTNWCFSSSKSIIFSFNARKLFSPNQGIYTGIQLKKIIKRTCILTLIALAAVYSTASSAGPIIQIDNNLYEMNKITGLLSTHRATIESQIWFGDSNLARAFANELGTGLGTQSYGQLGPAFGFEIYDGPGADYTKAWFYKPSNTHLESNNRAQMQNAGAGVYYTYAIAEHVGTVPVPEPSMYILLGLGLAGLRLSSRRRFH